MIHNANFFERLHNSGQFASLRIIKIPDIKKAVISDDENTKVRRSSKPSEPSSSFITVSFTADDEVKSDPAITKQYFSVVSEHEKSGASVQGPAKQTDTVDGNHEAQVPSTSKEKSEERKQRKKQKTLKKKKRTVRYYSSKRNYNFYRSQPVIHFF